MAKERPAVTADDVLVFIPNIIGYLRVVLTLASITLMICRPDRWVVGIGCYVASFVGDLFDGMAARKFDQSSAFGGLLDMVTDRCSTAGLLCVLSREYAHESTYALLFTMLIILDISSHWCQMYSTTSLRQHHKSADGNKGRFFLVRWYYLSYPFFGYCCVGAEFTYVALYIHARINDIGEYDNIGMFLECFLMISVPACAVKQIVNISQLCSSCYAVAAHDASKKNK
ncbi:hypothetical protein ACHAWF_010699 [Thalassiosira exigua]